VPLKTSAVKTAHHTTLIDSHFHYTSQLRPFQPLPAIGDVFRLYEKRETYVATCVSGPTQTFHPLPSVWSEAQHYRERRSVSADHQSPYTAYLPVLQTTEGPRYRHQAAANTPRKSICGGVGSIARDTVYTVFVRPASSRALCSCSPETWGSSGIGGCRGSNGALDAPSSSGGHISIG
jgi:hypothetical protein